MTIVTYASKDLADADRRFLEFLNDGERLLLLTIEQMNKKQFTFDSKTTEAWTYKLTEEEKARFKHLPTPCAIIGFKPKNINSDMEYDEMMFLANLKRKAKVEFENNLWKQRFEALNGFPMEEALGKENIIMPFSENDWLEKQKTEKL